MQIKYGIQNNNIDITNICLTKLLQDNIITIPSNDYNRSYFFTDPIFGTLKKIFINIDELEKEKILFKHRFEVIVFNEKNVNESIFINEGTGIHELFAINYAFNHSILLPSSFFIIKITARFYIPDFEEYLSTYNLTNYDCIVQNDRNRCELVGCKYKYFSHIFSMCINNNYIESEYKNKTSIYKNILICKLFTIDATQRGGVNQIYTTI